ncbi:MAG TPA: translocation/assembly module TamB domain-containing protein [Vicinamibacterales bacterium]|nr:translocation/assembly module TamB domain-containing protein [Vicinamibacterales bacterium]
MKRARLRLLCVVVGSVLLLLVLVISALHTSPVKRYLLSRVTTLLADSGIGLVVGQLDYNLFALTLSVEGVTLRALAAPDAPPFAHIDHADVDVGLLALLRGRYVVERGSIIRPSIHVVFDETGRSNLPQFPKDPDEEPAEPIDYLVWQFSISDAGLQLEDRRQPLYASLPVSSIEVAGEQVSRHRVRITSGGGQLRLQDRQMDIGRIASDLVIRRDSLSVERLELAATGLTAAVSGTLTTFADPRYDIVLDARFDVERLGVLAGLGDPVGGAVQANLTARGRLEELAADAHVIGTDLKFRSLDGVQLTADASYERASQRARVTQLEMTGPQGHLAGQGDIALEPAAGTSQLALTLQDLNLDRVTRALAAPIVAATRVKGRITAQWPALDYERADGDARLTFTPTRTAVSRNVLPLGGTLVASARDRQATLDVRELRALGATAAAHVTLIDRRALSGSVRLAAADLAQVVPQVESLLGRPPDSLVGTPIAGALNVDAMIGGNVGAPSVEATIAAPALSVGGLSDVSLGAQAHYTPETVTLRQLNGAWQDARLQASGSVGLEEPRPIALDAGLEGADIAALLAALGRTDIPAGGSVSLQARAEGTVTNPRATASVRAANLHAYGETLGTLSAEAELADRDVQLKELLLRKPQPDDDGILTASGSYHLDRRALDVRLDSEHVRLEGLTLPGDVPVRGAVQLEARAQGTLDNPTATARLVADDMLLRGKALGRLAIDGTVDGQQARVQARADRFGVDADAQLSTVEPYQTDVQVSVNDLDFAALPIEMDPRLTGRIRAHLEGSGSLSRPVDGSAVGTIDQLTAGWNGLPIVTDGPATFRYANHQLAIDRLAVGAQDSTLIVTGTLPVDAESGEGAVDLDARLNLATLASYAPAEYAVTAQGRASINGTVRGTIKAIDPSLVLSVDQASVGASGLEPGVSNIGLRVDVANGEAVLSRLQGDWGKAHLEARGRFPFDLLPGDLPIELPRRSGPAELQASLTNLELQALPGAPKELSGNVSVQADASAPRPDLSAVTGSLTFPDLRMRFKDLTLEQQGVSTIAIGASEARIERFDLAGTVGRLSLGGRLGLTAPQPLDAQAKGTIDIAAISALTQGVRAEGPATLDLAATGTARMPDLKGFVELTDASIGVNEPSVVSEGLDARVDLAGRRATLTRLEGRVNGGSLSGRGWIEAGAGPVPNTDLALSLRDVALDVPMNLRSLSSADIRVDTREEQLAVTGQVTVQEASLTDDIDLETGIFALITAPPSLDLTEMRNPLLERVRLNVDVDTASPVIVDNNLAEAEITADLRVVGTPYDTGLAGNLTIAEGSELRLNQRRYEVDRGIVRFIDDRRIVPSMDVVMRTSTRNYEITLQVMGTPGDTETTMTSEPSLAEPDIMALLVTGRTLDEMRGEELEVAKRQMMSQLAGTATSRIGRGLERATGLSSVRLEPNLIASETDPGARLTVGQDLSDDVRLIYSTDLANSSDQVWVAEYDVTRQFVSRAVRQSDASYRLDLNHDLRFGGAPEPRRADRRDKRRISSITIEGDTVVGEAEVRKRFGLSAGDRFDFFKIRQGIGRIEDAYREERRLQSRVRLNRTVRDDGVDLVLKVEAGPRVDLAFEGAVPPDSVRKKIEDVWSRGVFDTQRAGDALGVIREWLVGERHLEARLEHAITDAGPDARRIVFRIEPGRRFDRVELAFPGAAGIEPDVLEGVIKRQRLGPKVFTAPETVTELLRKFYRERGFLAAEIDPPQYDFGGPHARATIPVREGEAFAVRQLTASGNRVIDTKALTADLALVPGDTYFPAVAERSLEEIREKYWQRGYNDVVVAQQLGLDRASGAVDVTFTVTEGQRSVVSDIQVAGNDRTSDRLVRDQVDIEVGTPLDVAALGRSRRNLYDTGAFATVDVRREQTDSAPADTNGSGQPNAPGVENASHLQDVAAPRESQASQERPASPAASGTAPGDIPVRLNVAVREVQPFQLRYGLFYDTERHLGGIVDISNHNSLGSARVLGLRTRYDSQLREARLYLSQPSLRSLPLETTATVYYQFERHPETLEASPFNIDRVGVSFQQERQLRNRYVWNYGYRFERARTYDPRPGGLLDTTARVAPLTSTLTRDTRDDVLDATRGAFMSHAFSFSPEFLGSDVGFVKYFGQFFRYIALEPPRRERFTNEILRPRFVYAGGVRVGLAPGLGGDELPISERFLAGGSTTLRGFSQGAVGPIGPAGIPLGGQAMLIINNEVRAPLFKMIDGVVFVDVGNVFLNVSDFSLVGLRQSGGVGARVRTPWFLVRIDYGIPFDRRPGEAKSRVFFSIGQAF